jgi:hypothetical protein
LFTVLEVVRHEPLLIRYWPELPEIEIGEAALIPLTVIEFDVCRELRDTFVTSVNVNASGVVSDGVDSVVTVNVSETPPMFSVVFLELE